MDRTPNRKKKQQSALVWPVTAFFLTFVLLFFIKHYPTKKRTAVRMDEMGLNERVCTMLENRDNESKIAELTVCLSGLPTVSGSAEK